MSAYSWNIVATMQHNAPLVEGIGHALSLDVETLESGRSCSMFTAKDVPGSERGEHREIGMVHENTTRGMHLRIHSDATKSDLVVAMIEVAAIKHGRRTHPHVWRPITYRNGETGRYALIVRPLWDYGDDLHLIVRVPETVAELTSPSVRSTSSREVAS